MMRTLQGRLRKIRFATWQRNLYVLVLAELIAILGFNIANPFLPFYIQELGVTSLDGVAFWVGFISSTAPISMAVTSPFWGLLADRYGRKPMLVRAMFAGSVILIGLALAQNVQQVATLRILQGAFTGTIAAATTLVATMVPRERCGYSLGLLQTAVFIGSSLGPSAGGILGGTLGYRATFVISGLLLMMACILVVTRVHEEFVRAPARKGDGNALIGSLRAITGEPLLLAMVTVLVLINFSGSITGPVLPIYVQTLVPKLHEASTATGMILGATALSNAVGAIWIGRSGDRLGRRRVLLACLAVTSLVYFPQMLTTHPTQLLALRAIMGFAMGGVGPIANSIIAERAPEGRQGSVYGMSTSLNAAGNAIGPMLGAILLTNVSIGAVFPATGTLMAVAALVLALTTRSLDPPTRARAATCPPQATEQG